jgi:hypothetical protein
MHYEFTRLEKLINAVENSSSEDIRNDELQLWNEKLLDEKEALIKILTIAVKDTKGDREKINRYILHHHNRLIDFLVETEKFPKPIKSKLTSSIKDILLFLELNNNEPVYQDGLIYNKCFIPFSVEVISFFFRIMWEEGLIKMNFKSHLIAMLCRRISTLKAGIDYNVSEKHFTDSMYDVKASTINSVERILNRMKMRLNKIRNENGYRSIGH